MTMTSPTCAPEDTVAILGGLKERYEVHHGVRITDSALVVAGQRCPTAATSPHDSCRAKRSTSNLGNHAITDPNLDDGRVPIGR